MIRRPPSGDPFLNELVSVVNAELNRKEPTLVGISDDGTELTVRFRAPYGVGWVLVHLQSSEVASGGFTYNTSTYVSETLVDCRANRLQDFTCAVTDGVGYMVFLIPVQYDGAGVQVRYDGFNGAQDAMGIVSRWIVAGMSWSGGGLKTDTGLLFETNDGRHLALSGV